MDQGDNPQIAVWLDAICELGKEALYVPSQQRGRSAGINRGVESPKTPFVCVTDDDCFVEEKWLENWRDWTTWVMSLNTSSSLILMDLTSVTLKEYLNANCTISAESDQYLIYNGDCS